MADGVQTSVSAVRVFQGTRVKARMKTCFNFQRKLVEHVCLRLDLEQQPTNQPTSHVPGR
jgi:hypothetical protein